MLFRDNRAIMSLSLVAKYFPETSPEQVDLLTRFLDLVRDWNTRVNLVSRKDIENLEERHLLHSLAVHRIWKPKAGTSVLDVGTGGGFPGLPLAILHPDCRFTLVDSITKKCRAVTEIGKSLGLRNVRVLNKRVEQIKERFHTAFGRAVAPLPQFLQWTLPRLHTAAADESSNGVFYFKGTRYEEELAETGIRPATVWSLSEFFTEPFFAEKFLLRFVDVTSAIS